MAGASTTFGPRFEEAPDTSVRCRKPATEKGPHRESIVHFKAVEVASPSRLGSRTHLGAGFSHLLELKGIAKLSASARCANAGWKVAPQRKVKLKEKSR